MLSIIQGAALSFWVVKISSLPINWQNPLTEESFRQLLPYFVSFLLIIILWHSYFWLAVIGRWTPLIWDSLLMFLIGAIELFVINNMNHYIWYYSLGFLGILAGIQYIYNAERLNDEVWDIDAKEIGRHIRQYKKKRGQVLIFFSCAGMLIIFVVHIFRPNYLYLSAIIILFVQFWTIREHLRDQKNTLSKLKIYSVNK